MQVPPAYVGKKFRRIRDNRYPTCCADSETLLLRVYPVNDRSFLTYGRILILQHPTQSHFVRLHLV